MVNFVYTFVGTLFIQMWPIFIHLRVIYTNVVDFYTFEGGFIRLRELIHLKVQHGAQCTVRHVQPNGCYIQKDFIAACPQGEETKN